MNRTTCCALMLALLAASPAAAAPGDDSYIAGYAAAVLEREFSLSAPSLSVQNGVLSVAAADLATADRARVVAQLEKIPGVARVVVLEPGVLAPAPPPSSSPEPPRILSEWQVGGLPGGPQSAIVDRGAAPVNRARPQLGARRERRGR